MTISSWLNFGHPAHREGCVRLGKIFGSALLQPACSVCVFSELFFILRCSHGSVVKALDIHRVNLSSWHPLESLVASRRHLHLPLKSFRWNLSVTCPDLWWVHRDIGQLTKARFIVVDLFFFNAVNAAKSQRSVDCWHYTLLVMPARNRIISTFLLLVTYLLTELSNGWEFLIHFSLVGQQKGRLACKKSWVFFAGGDFVRLTAPVVTTHHLHRS